jgi:hypothetical protein
LDRENNVDLDALGNIGDLLSGIGVVVTLAYLAVQIRRNTAAVSAQVRHSLSDFVLHISIFRAEHADRYAKLKSGEHLTAGDLEFRYWSHMQMMLHAETYFHHFGIGLMPESHWSGYVRYIEGYIESDDFREFWEDAGPTFSTGFRAWIDAKLQGERAP